MTLLTADQVTEIADALEALGLELGTRNWDPQAGDAVLASAAGSLVSVAAMRAPYPQQAYLQPPPYPYGADDFAPGAGQSVPLNVTVTGHTKGELERHARQHGTDFFGPDADLVVTLAGGAAPLLTPRASDDQVYTCAATIRERAQS